MKKLILVLAFAFLQLSFAVAQTVVRTQHRAAVVQDVVTTGTMTIRKPSYICISTNQEREQLIMDGSKFTMTMGGKKHVTDSRKNAQFATFHEVLKAVIANKPIPESSEMSVSTKNGQKTIVITPVSKKKRQMFSSFELVIDEKTSAIKQLRMNERGGNYVNYVFK